MDRLLPTGLPFSKIEAASQGFTTRAYGELYRNHSCFYFGNVDAVDNKRDTKEPILY